ncbi:MAG: hypothetical protein PHR16_17540, partial [Methylovulum sp.]|nr:hypothetical protein [Methylovulum sp.]
MAETHVISALTAKRSELAGLVAHHRKEMIRFSEEVKTIDATIKLFEPDYRIQTIKTKRHQKKNDFFKHGEAHRLILDILREAGKPLSTNDIAQAVMSVKGIECGHEKALQASILTILHRQKKSGLVGTTGKDLKGNCI